MGTVASPDQTSPELDATRVEPSGGSATGVEAPADERGLDLARGMQVGRYLVLDSLGAGGMGEVFSAYDPDLDRRVALKLVKFGAREDAELARSRLLREAQALAKLSHPNVVAVYDAGTHGDRVFIAMEYVQGHTLRRWISEAAEREAAPSWRVALELMLQAGRGLAAAHAQGLVHRDFKPANVMVSEDGRVRVLDFGLARRFGENDSLPPQVELVVESLDGASGPRSSLELQLTQTGMVMGTPAYMAPEQFFGGHIDARTDQFAFCVVLYRVLFGLRPFVGESYRELGRAVARGELREMPKAARVPRSIQAAVRRGLSVGRDDRFASMDELLDALERGAGEGRRRRMLAGTGALLLAGLGTAGLLGRQGERAPAPCQGAEAKLEGIWDDDRRAAVRAAFEATALPYAEDARVAVERALDEHLGRWVELRTEVCEATRVRGDQSEALMDLRIGCLDGKLRDVVALTEVLAQADADVVKNATNGLTNPNARYQKAVSVEEVLASPVVADPLHLLEICATSDGGAAIVLSSMEFAQRHTGSAGSPVRIAAVSTVTPTYPNTVIDLPDMATDSTAVVAAPARAFKESIAHAAYEESGIGPEDLSLAEVYDLSTALELDWYEDIGLCARGEAEKLLNDGDTSLGGRIPVNPSGGLACFGEAVPAQAIAQVCEVTWQLRGQATGRQVDGATSGITANQGLFGHGSAVLLAR